MKNIRLAALILAVSVCFSGCTISEADAKERYKAAFDKMSEMKSYETTATSSMEMYGTAAMEMELKSSVLDGGETAVHDLYVNAMGAEQESRMYQFEGSLYTELGDGMYLKQDSEINALSHQGLTALSSAAMSDNYISAIESGENFSFTANKDKSVSMSFDFSGESRKAIAGDIGEVLLDTMLGDMDAQLSAQYAELGISGEELDMLVEITMEAYEEMYKTVEVESIRMEVTVDKNGFMTAQDIDMVMALSLDMSGLTEALGQGSVEAESIQLLMSSSSAYENINGDVTVDIPEFTGENTIVQ